MLLTVLAAGSGPAGSAQPGSAAAPYGWPLKPFHAAHPVRGYFNDPRFLRRTSAFHYGIDIPAPAGTAVHAVEAGHAHVSVDSVAVVMPGGRRTFGYWHVDALVRDGARVRRHQLIGRVQEEGPHRHYADGRHLHFTELLGGEYRDPLRPGALTPWTDAVAPTIRGVELVHRGRQVRPADVDRPVDVIVDAFDRPPLAVPSPWAAMPVTPARLSWRVLRGKTVVRGWRTPVDFRHGLLPRSRFATVYAPGTRQNRASRPGLYRFFLAHDWSAQRLAAGSYRLEVEAADGFGNAGRAQLVFRVTRPRPLAAENHAAGRTLGEALPRRGG